ncbi:MAG: 1-(5-phosphoribosyl)-5-[(5-phosphoribosylamino)methylideneamino]imidazole-4-carboxamide isomerase [Candidatus Omnitrophica bacterium]|nr:1-(5-phosphoribosyl)-5-[(5-phosphoribosylamino)methylideneamino]imidazole-4-carboxamide isomerase [Candidatus Omnitrophota bacterium]
MLIIPAVDIQEGCVVRFIQGRLDKKVYSRDPVKTSRHWASQGARLIHVVDLDGANTGIPGNIDVVKEIVKAAGAPVQVGGGIRTEEVIKTLLDCGVSRVILGTKAAEDEAFLSRIFKKFKDNIVVSIDAKDGQVLTKGWQAGCADTNMDALEFACALRELGFKQVIYTDVSRDGTLSGPNIQATKRLLKTGLSVIASGGVSSLEDIKKLKKLEKEGLAGVIIGKALYEGRFTLSEALKLS